MQPDKMETLQDLGLVRESHQYGQHSLQTLTVWRYLDRPQQRSGSWIIYIHGGAWRDPRLTADDFVHSIQHIRSSSDGVNDCIKGFISIDYRLSPHPDFPQDPATTESSDLRNAQHPDHIQDIWSALEFVQLRYEVSEDYILIGHSAGATLAYQLLMSDSVPTGHPRPQVPLPSVIIGISGIYDLVKIDQRHDGQYAGFISGAFGTDKAIWASASPAQFNGSFKEKWPAAKSNILAWSPEDTLIDEPEIDAMVNKLRHNGLSVEIRKDLHGDHDFVWEDGKQIGDLLKLALEKLGYI